jgi:carboxymethylenebutenolidase
MGPMQDTIRHETTRIDTPDGGSDAYLALPPSPPGPGIVALHAWWGLNRDFRDFANRLATDGFAVIAPDLFDGTVLDTIEDAERFAEELDEEHNAERLLGRAAASLDHLLNLPDASGERIALLGFSFGAVYARWLAKTRPEVAAVVTYYGGAWDPPGEPSNAPWLSHWAAEDPYEAPDDARKAVEAQPGAVSHIYDGTRHWFAEPARPEYVEAASEQAYARTVAFLRERLG